MTYGLVYWPAADDVLNQLENDPGMTPVLRAIERTLGRLAEDPLAPRLGTTAFVSEAYGGISATPAGHDEWYVLWQRGSEPMTIEIVLVHQLRT
jgi:hypothetical protein